MKVSLYTLKQGKEEKHPASDEVEENKVQLVLCFGQRKWLSEADLYEKLHARFPSARIVIASTAGEIYHDVVMDAITITAIQFDHTEIKAASVNIGEYNSSREAGKELARQILAYENLCYLLVISDGGKVNGSELVEGLNDMNPHHLPITGGLAGDGADFIETIVGLDQQPVAGNIVLIGFIGNKLRIRHGSMGGWEVFGPERTVTRSQANQLFEVNHENALDLYKKYLGKYADDLPGSALLFPLSVKMPGQAEQIVRTILSIDNRTGSMTFAGNVPEGSSVRFMKANFDKLVVAASDAASGTIRPEERPPRFSLLISCVGRKIILGNRIDEEVEAVNEVLGPDTLLTGFYSYGEISPFNPETKCELHNQTMTITTFSEQ